MSTRSIIVLTGKNRRGHGSETIRLYKHSDGYPTGNLPIIGSAIERALAQNAEQQALFSEPKPDPISVNQLTGLVIGEATTCYGMGAKVDDNWTQDKPGDMAVFEEPFQKSKHLGRQSDLEWVYIVDLDKLTVSILGGGYTGKTPETFKLADPYKYVERLRAECKNDERTATTEAINAIEALGFKVVSKAPAQRKPEGKKLAVVRGAV